MNLQQEFHPVPKPIKLPKVKRPMRKRVTKRARAKEFPASVKAIVRERSNGLCERCCVRPLMHFHHCYFRSDVTRCTNGLSNCLGLCSGCHMWDDDSAHKSRETREWCVMKAKELAGR